MQSAKCERGCGCAEAPEAPCAILRITGAEQRALRGCYGMWAGAVLGSRRTCVYIYVYVYIIYGVLVCSDYRIIVYINDNPSVAVMICDV